MPFQKLSAIDGVFFFYRCTSYRYGDSTDTVIWGRIQKGQWDFNDPVWDNISDEAKDLIKNLICVDAAKRFDTKQLLAHAWITQHKKMPKAPLKSYQSKRSLFEMNGITQSMRNIQVQSSDMSVVDEVVA